MFIEAVAFGGFGLIFGSFANVLILRHGTDRTIGGRSSCPSCGRTLEWFDLVPLLSWLVLRGRCRTCHAGISFQYPLVEVLGMLGFITMGLAPVPLIVRIIGCAIIILFIAIAAYDLRHMLMPDVWVFGFAALAFTGSFVQLVPMVGDWISYATLIASGPIVALPLFLMWYFSRGAWMGFGDVKFALGMGWLLGIYYGYLALMYSFVLGALIGVVLIALPRILQPLHRIGITSFHAGSAGFTMKSEVPFGPFLILGTCIVWFAILYSIAPVLSFPGAFLFWSY